MQTYIFRQMSDLPGCIVQFASRHRVPDHPYPEDKVRFFGLPGVEHRGRWSWRLTRLRQKVSRRYAWLRWKERVRLKALLEEFAPHLVHAHWAPDAMLAVDACLALDIPLIVQFHGYDVSRLVRDPIYLRSLRLLFRQMALGITVSDDMKQRLLDLGCPGDRIRCHYIGVPDEFFAKAARRAPAERFILLQVGRLAEVKGHRFALAAVAKVRGSGALNFRILGDGELRGVIERQIQELEISGNVELLGWRDPAEVVREMWDAHALILPSSTARDGGVEGLPTVAVEAMASGLPVIGTRHGGIPEALRYTEADWLAQEGDVQGLANRIERLACDVGLWRRLSEEGQRIAQEYFHLPTQNLRLETLYREVLIREDTFRGPQGGSGDSWSG
jgi:colanic acid/amylovoran biosynthesis glycosyltransferase